MATFDDYENQPPGKQVTPLPGAGDEVDEAETTSNDQSLSYINDDVNRSLLKAALGYASRGWCMFPCGNDKKPLINDWPHRASSDPEQIRLWWVEHPEASIGFICGPDTGVWVLDVDLKSDGPGNLEKLLAKHGPLPETLHQKTGGGGSQYFWKWNGREIRNSAGKVAKGIDVRGAGGYVILPPSGHPSGGVYRWENYLDPAEAPDWLLDLACPREKANEQPHAPSPHTGEGTPYGKKALAEELTTLSRATEGARNDTLNKCTFSLAQLVAGGELPEEEVRQALFNMALAIGLDTDESAHTIHSAFTEGMKSPRVNAEEVCPLFAGIICPLCVGIKCPLNAGLVKTRYPVQASPRQPWGEARTFPLCAFP